MCHNIEICIHVWMIRSKIVLPLGEDWLAVKHTHVRTRTHTIYICMLIYYRHKQAINPILSLCHPLTMIQVPLMTENLHDGTLWEKSVHVIRFQRNKYTFGQL